MSNPSIFAEQLDRLTRRQQNDKLATAMTVTSCALLAATVCRQLMADLREKDHEG